MALTSQDLIFGYRFNKINFNVPGNVFPDNIGATNSFRIKSDDIQEMLINWGDGTFQTFNFPSPHKFSIFDNYHIFPKNVTLTGTDGTGNISFGANDFLVTFTTDLATTASNFIATHETALEAINIKVTANAEVLTFTFQGTNQDLPVFTNLTVDLNATITDTKPNYNISFTFEKPELISSISSLNISLGDTFPDTITKLRSITSIAIKITIGGNFGLQSFPSNLSTLEKLHTLIVEKANFDKIDESVLNLTALETLSLSGSIDLNNSVGNFEATNFDKLRQLQNTLKTLELSFCNITEFPSNFIQMTNLEKLNIGDNPFTTLSPNLPTSLKEINFVRSNSLSSWTNFGWLENLEYITFGENNDLGISIAPTVELSECKRLKSYTQKGLNVSNRDAFILNFYNFVTTYANLNPSDASIDQNKFRDMIFSIFQAPEFTGTYEAPTGFIQGSANGTPTTPEERVYVLVENYGHTWTVGSQTYEQI